MDFLYTTEETKSVDKIPEEGCSEVFFQGKFAQLRLTKKRQERLFPMWSASSFSFALI